MWGDGSICSRSSLQKRENWQSVDVRVAFAIVTRHSVGVLSWSGDMVYDVLLDLG